MCTLCPHHCTLSPNTWGYCNSRYGVPFGITIANWGKLTACHSDPIEKKPLFHFYPGSKIMSVGSFGCNMTCSFCQNHGLSQNRLLDTPTIEPEDFVAKVSHMDMGIGLAFTYNEPVVMWEYLLALAPMVRKLGKKVVVVTNGLISQEALYKGLPHIDAMNIDLKAFDPIAYNQLGGDLETVKATIQTACRETHVEVTTLIVPNFNDDLEKFEAMVSWLASVNPLIPLHISRYYPQYQMTQDFTPAHVLTACLALAKKYLKYVYLGNFYGYDNPTLCHQCGTLLAERNVFETTLYATQCPTCGAKPFVTG